VAVPVWNQSCHPKKQGQADKQDEWCDGHGEEVLSLNRLSGCFGCHQWYCPTSTEFKAWYTAFTSDGNWHAGWGSNPLPDVLETAALPVSYTTHCEGGKAGIKPTTVLIRLHVVTTLLSALD
jgi:hypothetical protein